MGHSGGQQADGGHFFMLHQMGLGGLQVVVGRLQLPVFLINYLDHLTKFHPDP